MTTRRIEIRCITKDNADLDELKEFQGDLKEMSDVSKAKLKGEIINTGFAFPFLCWKDPKRKTLWILGGHQRARALRELRDEGYDVPRVPIVLVDAKHRVEAKSRVLQDIAQYGKITNEGLNEFLNESGLKFDEIVERFTIPDFDLNSFGQVYFPSNADPKEVSFTATGDGKGKSGSKELGEEEFKDFDHECPKCGFHFNDKEE